MVDDYIPDVKIAETYVCHGAEVFEVYTFERSSSAAGHGDHRYHETHVYRWDGEKRRRGQWLGQHSTYRGVDLHCHVIAAVARDGAGYKLAELTTAEALHQWRKLAKSLYDWEEIEAVNPFSVPYKGPRRSKPEGYEELTSTSGSLTPAEWSQLVEASDPPQ